MPDSAKPRISAHHTSQAIWNAFASPSANVSRTRLIAGLLERFSALPDDDGQHGETPTLASSASEKWEQTQVSSRADSDAIH